MQHFMSFYCFLQGQSMPAAPEHPPVEMPLPSAIVLRLSPLRCPGTLRFTLRNKPRAHPRAPASRRLRPARWPRGNGSSTPKARSRGAPPTADHPEHFSAWPWVTPYAERALTWWSGSILTVHQLWQTLSDNRRRTEWLKSCCVSFVGQSN